MSLYPCNDPDAITTQALALLPRGRAWQTHEGGPRPESVLYRFWRSVGEVFAFLNGRLCELRDEFFCYSADETLDIWLAEYGLPDPCDPYPDLCIKVAAEGGARCEDYVALATRAGWDIDCYQDIATCGALADNAAADCVVADGAARAAVLTIRVYPETSPAFQGVVLAGPYADAMQADMMLSCPPDISGLICILSRVVHAHIALEFVIGDPRTTLTDAPITADSGQPTDGATT